MSITPDQQAEIVRILCQLLLESENPRIRARAAKSLGRLGVPDAIHTLCQAVSTDSDVQVRLNAMDALVLFSYYYSISEALSRFGEDIVKMDEV